jgi:hypothetical protein
MEQLTVVWKTTHISKEEQLDVDIKGPNVNDYLTINKKENKNHEVEFIIFNCEGGNDTRSRQEIIKIIMAIHLKKPEFFGNSSDDIITVDQKGENETLMTCLELDESVATFRKLIEECDV